jgi:hypothetical protein
LASINGDCSWGTSWLSADALTIRLKPGRPRKVKLQRGRDLLLPVLENPAQAGGMHWTGAKVHGCLKEQLSLALGCYSAVRWLHELNFHLRTPAAPTERPCRSLKSFIDQPEKTASARAMRK